MFSWSPDGQYFIYSQDDQPYLIKYGQEPIEIKNLLGPVQIQGFVSVDWIDNSTYLLHLTTEQGHLLWLGSIDGLGYAVDLSESKISNVESVLP